MVPKSNESTLIRDPKGQRLREDGGVKVDWSDAPTLQGAQGLGEPPEAGRQPGTQPGMVSLRAPDGANLLMPGFGLLTSGAARE